MHSFTFAASVLASTLFSAANAAPTPGPSGLVSTYYGQKGTDIEALCEDDSVDIVPIAFVNHFASNKGEYSRMNFANNGWATEFYVDGNGKKHTDVFDNNHFFVNTVAKCQANGKKVLVSLGGADEYSDVRLQSTEHAQQIAVQLWKMFGPLGADYVGPRPFGKNVVDGFDFDIEGEQASSYHADLAKAFRSLFNGDSSKQYYLSAAPQCPTPDVYKADPLLPALATGLFDHVFVQFYNNYCGAHTYGTKSDQFTHSWNWWSTQLAGYNKNTKLFLGIPGGPGATEDAKYQLTASQAKAVIQSVSKTSNFGGVMLWDYSLAAKNDNFHAVCQNAMGAPSPPKTTTTSSTTTSSTTSAASTTTSSSTYVHTTRPSSTPPAVSTTTTTSSSYVHTTKPSSTPPAVSTTTTSSSYVHTTKPSSTTSSSNHGRPTSSSSSTEEHTWSDYEPTTTTKTSSSKPVEPTTTETAPGHTWSDSPEPTTKTSSSKPVKPTTTETAPGHTWSDSPEPTTKTSSSKPVKPTSTAILPGSTWSDVPNLSTETASTTTTVTAHWSDYPGATPAAPHTRFETVYVDEYVTECGCAPAATSTPVSPEESKPTTQSWEDSTPTTIASVPVSNYTPTKSAPPIATFTGAATQQLPATVLSVSACVAVAIVGLFL